MLTKLSWGRRGQSLLIDHQCWNARCRKGKSNSDGGRGDFASMRLRDTFVLSPLFQLCHNHVVTFLKKTKYVEVLLLRMSGGWGRRGGGEGKGSLPLCRVIRSEGRLRARKESVLPPFSSLFIPSAVNSVWSSNSLSKWIWMNERMNEWGKGACSFDTVSMWWLID